jgi:hypothetical protein
MTMKKQALAALGVAGACAACCAIPLALPLASGLSAAVLAGAGAGWLGGAGWALAGASALAFAAAGLAVLWWKRPRHPACRVPQATGVQGRDRLSSAAAPPCGR